MKDHELFWGSLNLDKINQARDKIKTHEKYGRSIPIKAKVLAEPDQYGNRVSIYVPGGMDGGAVFLANLKLSEWEEKSKATADTSDDLPFLD